MEPPPSLTTLAPEASASFTRPSRNSGFPGSGSGVRSTSLAHGMPGAMAFTELLNSLQKASAMERWTKMILIAVHRCPL